MGDTENILNNYLSTLNTKLEQAALAVIFVQELSPLLSTLTCRVCCPTEKQEKQSKKANGLLNLIKTSMSWTNCTASTVFFLFKILFFPFSLSPLPIATAHCSGRAHTRTLGTSLGKSLVMLSLAPDRQVQPRGKAKHATMLGDGITALCTPLQISQYTNICGALSWLCLQGFPLTLRVSHFTPRWIIADQISNYISVIKPYTYC